MKLIYRCEWCSQDIPLHRGKLIDVPRQERLWGMLIKVHDGHDPDCVKNLQK